MNLSCSCSQGHEWTVPLTDGLEPTLPLLCPTCGAPAHLAPPTPADEPTLARPAAGDAPALASNLALPGVDDPTLDSTLARDLPATAHAEPYQTTLKDAGTAAAASLAGAMPNYEILEQIGRGGMGVVYKARQIKLNRLVALKMILGGANAGADELQRFRTEAEVVAQIQHPNIVQIYEVGEQDGRPYFSLEYVAGGTLASLMQGKPLEPAAAAQLIRQLARAIQAAHQRGIIHRDLKPANVLMTPEGTPKITDFGLAKDLSDIGQTRTGAILGTPSYMAPEQALGKTKDLGPATDVYALGAILYQLLTGLAPFRAESALRVLRLVEKEEPVPPRRLEAQVPRDLETICLKCLEKNPKRRYPSGEALAQELDRFLAGEPILARPTGPLERLAKWARRRPERAALLLVSIVATITIASLARLDWREKALISSLRDSSQATPPVAVLQLKEYAEEDIRHRAAELRRVLVKKLLQARQRDGWFCSNLAHLPKACDIEVASHGTIVKALLGNPDATRAEQEDYLTSLDLPLRAPFLVVQDGKTYGLRAHATAPQADVLSTCRVTLALVQALKIPGLLTGARRDHALQQLSELQQALNLYRRQPFDGAWNYFPTQVDREKYNTWATTLVFLVLLDSRQVGKTWAGGTEQISDLLLATASFLFTIYDPSTTPPGWDLDNDPERKILETMSLRIYSLLVRYQVEAGGKPPGFVIERVPRDLLRLASSPTDNREQEKDEVFLDILDTEGKLQRGQGTYRSGWYPWMLTYCSNWLRLREKHLPSEKNEDLIQGLRGYLVMDLGEKMTISNVDGPTYIPANRLQALSTIPPLGSPSK